MSHASSSGPESHNEQAGKARNVVQAGTILGGVHVNEPSRPRAPVPRQIPLDVPYFTGRAAALAELDALVFGEDAEDAEDPEGTGNGSAATRVAAIAGPAGVGKTALAVHWAHRVQDRLPDGSLYVNLRGFDAGPPKSPQEALEGFLSALGAHPAGIPAGLEAQSALYRSLLDGRRMLVVLDNAANAEQVRPLLPGSAECRVIVTSRSSLSGLVIREGVRRVTLDLLTPVEANALLRRTLGPGRVEAEPGAADELARCCARLPLGLHIAAERAALRPHATLADLVAELSDEQDRLNALATADDETTAVRAVFSWSYRALSPEAARAFRLLGLHAGPDISTPAAAALLGVTPARARGLLDALIGVHLLEETEPDRFRFHDLLRAYAAERARSDEPEADLARAVRRVLAWYLHTGYAACQAILSSLPYERLRIGPLPAGCPPMSFAGWKQALAWCDMERANLVAATRQAAETGEFAIAWKIPASLACYFDNYMHNTWSDLITSHRVGIAAARRIDDPYGESWLLICLGRAYRALCRYDEAARCHEKTHALLSQGGDQWLMGMNRGSLGLLHLDTRRYEEAVTAFGQAIDLFRDIGDRWGEAWVWMTLGLAYSGLKRAGQAFECSRRSLRLHRELDDPWTRSWALHALGRAYHGLGRFEEAIASYFHAIALQREVDQPFGEAWTLVALGNALRAMSRPDEAREYWRRAVATMEELGIPQAERVRARLQAL
jgi:tetratricopeptide (TPR) repeat protein